MKKIVTISEAAYILGCTKAMLYYYTKNWEFPKPTGKKGLATTYNLDEIVLALKARESLVTGRGENEIEDKQADESAKIVSLIEASRLLNCSYSSVTGIKHTCVFPKPIGREGKTFFYYFHEVEQAFKNRISLKTEKISSKEELDKYGRRSEKGYNEGGQYIHYGDYKVDTSWDTQQFTGDVGDLSFKIW